jgi:adenylate cyclase
MFSIGTKLITIFTIVVLVSLVSITALVSHLVRQDMQIAAEEHNVEVNRRTAMETEAALANVRSLSRMLIHSINAAGTESAIASQDAARSTVDFFFDENPQIAVVFFTSGAQADGMVVNSRFFRSKEIDEALAYSYLVDCAANMKRAAAGETLLLNATPHFIVPALALFFPWNNGGAGVLFSPAGLDDAYYFGAHRSYLVNDSGDMLIHTDFDLVKDGVNMADGDFIRQVWDNQATHSMTLYADEDGMRYFMAFTKLNTGTCAVITGIEYDSVFTGINAATRRNVYLTALVFFISILLIWFSRKASLRRGNKNG